jgi:hypothetical protein
MKQNAAMKKTLLPMALALIASGCAGADVDSSEELGQGQGKAETMRVAPVGSFVNDEPQGEEFLVLMLKTDGTFHREKVITCASDLTAVRCRPIVSDGLYEIIGSGAARSIRFLDQEGGLIDEYVYRNTGDMLKLRLNSGSEWQSMHLDAGGWCVEADDCALQELRPSDCSGEWTCTQRACQYRCAP